MKTRLHIPAIDTLRGVAASMVCFYHFVCTTTGLTDPGAVYDLFHLGYYGVHVFFVISGMVIPLSMILGNYTHRSWFNFMARRFVRIEPPYLASVVIGVGYLVLRNFIPGTAPVDLSPDAMTLLLHVGYLIPFFEGFDWINNVYWSLAVEFQYYLFLCLIFPLFLSGKTVLRVLLYLLFFGAAQLVTTKMSMLPVWLPLFMVGIIYILWRYEYVGKVEFLLVLLSSLIMTAVNIDMKATIFGAATLGVVHFLPRLRNTASKFLGDISYSLYLLHTIVGSALINYISHHIDKGWEKTLLVLAGYGVSILTAYFLYKWVELPSKRLSSKIKY